MRCPLLQTTAAALFCASLLSACGSEPPSTGEPALPNVTPDQQTLNPTPSVTPGTEDTKTISANTQGTLAGVRVGVMSVSDDQASMVATPVDTGEEAEKEAAEEEAEPEYLDGSPGDSFDLATGHTLTIDDLKKDPDHGEGGSSTVTITVRAPR